MIKNNCNLNNNDNCNSEGNQLVLLAAMISFILSNDLNSSQQNVLGTFLQSVGQNLELISIMSAKCESSKESVNGANINNNNL